MFQALLESQIRSLSLFSFSKIFQAFSDSESCWFKAIEVKRLEVSKFINFSDEKNKFVFERDYQFFNWNYPNFTNIYTFRTLTCGKIHHAFTSRSARRPSEARKPEVQFRFVELRLSVCACFPGKARVHILSELRLRFPSPPIPTSLRRRSWTRQQNVQMIQYFTPKER